MKTTIVLFTYRGEEELLPHQANHLAKVLPFASVHIIDDARDPIPASLSAHSTPAFTTRKASSTEAAASMEVSASWACSKPCSKQQTSTKTPMASSSNSTTSAKTHAGTPHPPWLLCHLEHHPEQIPACEHGNSLIIEILTTNQK